MTEQILLALVLAAFTGGIAGYLGSLMLTKRMALMGGALGHLTLPGIALALLYGFDVSLGALLFLGLGVLIIGYLHQKTKLHLEAVTAVVFATSLSVAFLFLPEEEVEVALIGDISGISLTTVLVTAGVAAAIFVAVHRIYANMVLIGISSDLAQATGVNLKLHNAVYLVAIALTVALGVRIVGGLMTAALLAIPACTARNLSTSLSQYAYTSAAAGSLACLIGIAAFAVTGISAGLLIIIASAVLFLLSVFTRRTEP